MASSSTAAPLAGAKSILLLHGPNLNLLGMREPEKYGTETLEDVVNKAKAQAEGMGIKLDALQTNHEGVIIDRIHQARFESVDAIILNAGAWTHTSVALRDALLAADVPFIEVHITNVHAREPFRHHSYLSDKATGVIAGLGTYGYVAAIDFAARYIKPKSKPGQV
ncbi:hypothetical protein OC834_002585 [Tilletia horrida]|uniref:Catabolic 3-dehydroquinase n=1 Tax=Tilletia horrida TaxID=155126 RepID=A0AAN6JLZ5_9BASI|nr:hypothetical protein OC835_003714 [Tilletia horrida]KAK0532475.1 hypothetical protein OC834_002585 [Tilletia horrida]KAK0534010.1 hypothetical protein OC842_002783 [Tilletia horrida]KAK0563362.1 hypothetical protein OC844_002253 [Tilletia horrida]